MLVEPGVTPPSVGAVVPTGATRTDSRLCLSSSLRYDRLRNDPERNRKVCSAGLSVSVPALWVIMLWIQIYPDLPAAPPRSYVCIVFCRCLPAGGGRAGGCLRSICLLWFCPELPLQFPCSQKPSPEGIGLRRLPRSLCTRIYNIYI